ncbi:MAG: cobyrinate a,c-diamide synthase [Desulfobacteraceae bacterium]|nr:MAG: cobyrinate a,c-diamide synthase [Desulfobacteraceae bacterium]
MTVPGIVISALKGGAGKSILSIGIVASLRDKGKTVAPFKKGPDYIDAGWLALAAGRPCYNLDLFLIDRNTIQKSYIQHTRSFDYSIIEGNRGLFDGIDVEGHTSTAEIAKLLDLPVVMCVDCTKTTRTMSAVLRGCMQFDPEVKLKGVVLNHVAGPRHENILRQSIEHHCGIPVIGAIPKLKTGDFPERHMGLVPTPEHAWAEKSISAAMNIVKQNVDLDALVRIAESNTGILDDPPDQETENSIEIHFDRKPRIGVIRDSAFQFYYQENLDALETAGAELVFTSPLTDVELPPIDALYIGGGFPETHAQKLSDNETYRNMIKDMADDGMPIYAECGGLMYLGERLEMGGQTYDMAGLFPIVFGLSKRPQGHGYTIMAVDQENPFFPVGTELKGHEFRYSTIQEWRGTDEDMVFATIRGTGFCNNRDGLNRKNVLATYTHIHALGIPFWSYSLVKSAVEYSRKKSEQK